jgi:predicted ribosomally synthesized peptide with SipW-like signal peptide
MNKKALVAIFIAGLVATMAGAGTFSYFNDTETSSGNTFTAGTLDLKVDGQDDPNVVHIVLSDIAPGWEQGYKWTLKNVGSVSGKVSVKFSAITNWENDMNEPEIVAEAQPYGYQGARQTLGHPTDGELGEYLSITGGYYYPGPNDWHEFITSRNTGPYAYGQSWGLNRLGGNTYNTGVTLNPGEEIGIGLVLWLNCPRYSKNLQAWDGCGWHDIDDNVIQGDSVVFDITFSLVQP